MSMRSASLLPQFLYNSYPRPILFRAMHEYYDHRWIVWELRVSYSVNVRLGTGRNCSVFLHYNISSLRHMMGNKSVALIRDHYTACCKMLLKWRYITLEFLLLRTHHRNIFSMSQLLPPLWYHLICLLVSRKCIWHIGPHSKSYFHYLDFSSDASVYDILQTSLFLESDRPYYSPYSTEYYSNICQCY